MLNHVHEPVEGGVEGGSIISARSSRDLAVDRADALRMDEGTLKTWEERECSSRRELSAVALLKLQFEHGDATASLIFHLIKVSVYGDNGVVDHCSDILLLA